MTRPAPKPAGSEVGADAVVVRPRVAVTRYMDGVDAGAHVHRWLSRMGRQWRAGRAHVETYGLRLDDPTAMPNGRVTVVWAGTRQVGIATIVRDEMNFSVLTIVELAHG